MRVDGRRLAAGLLLVALVVVVGLGWGSVFGTDRVATAVVVAGLVPGLAAVAAPARVRAPVLAPLLVVVVLVLGALLARATPGVFLDALVHGWARVLDGGLPAPDAPDRLPIVPTTVGLAATAAGVWARRPAALVAPLAPPVVLLVLERLMTTRGDGGSLVPEAVALLVGGLAVVALRSPGAGGDPGLRPTLRLLAGGVAAVVVGGLVAATAPTAEAYDPSAGRRPAVLPTAPVVNPLDLLQASTGGTEPVADVTIRPASTTPTRLRLAALPGYDRGDWVQAGDYAEVAQTLPPVPSGRDGITAARTSSVEVTVVDTALPGPWLPLPGRVTSVDTTPGPLLLDQADASLVLAAPPPAGSTVALRVQLPADPTTDELLTAQPDGDAGSLATPVPGTPPVLVTLAQGIVGTDGAPPFVRLGRLQQYFRQHFSVDPTAPAGHSLGQLAAFLGVGRGTGTSEQFATAYVVLARAVGLPARVAVGYTLAPGSTTLVSGDLTAWPEVALRTLDGEALGWVALDPVPATDTVGAAPQEEPQGAAAQAATKLASDPASTETAAQEAATTAPAADEGGVSGRLVLLLALLVLLLVAPPLVLLVREQRWRARWQSGSAERRVAGAWLAVRRALRRSGVAVPPSSTTSDVVALARPRLPAELAPVLDDLARRQAAAVFAAPGRLPATDADAAWVDARRVSHGLLAAADRSRRVRLRLGLTGAAWR